MNCIKTPISDLYVIEPTIYRDKRGYFFESFNQKKFLELTSLNIQFVQDNQSKSTRGVLRGMHFQKGENAQAKLVRVLEGEVQDVAVDLRPQSATYGKYFSIVLSKQNNKQLFIPRGFAHGFLVLSKEAVFSYKCDNYYNKDSEGGIAYNSINIQIPWQLPTQELILSEKDINLPPFET